MNMLADVLMVLLMEKVKRKAAIPMKANLSKAINTEKVFIHGKTEVNIQAAFLKISFMEKVLKFFPVGLDTMAIS